MHCPNVRARTATPPGTTPARSSLVLGIRTTSVTPGIALIARHVQQRLGVAVDRRRPAEHRRQRVLDLQVHRELLAPGDDVARVDAALARADQLELRLALGLGLLRAAGLRDRGGARQLAVAERPAAGRDLRRRRPSARSRPPRAGRPPPPPGARVRWPPRCAAARRAPASRPSRAVNWLNRSSGLASASVTLTDFERHVHLVGDDHRAGRVDALAVLRARQVEGDRAVGLDGDLDQALRRARRVHQQVRQVVERRPAAWWAPRPRPPAG